MARPTAGPRRERTRPAAEAQPETSPPAVGKSRRAAEALRETTRQAAEAQPETSPPAVGKPRPAAAALRERTRSAAEAQPETSRPADLEEAAPAGGVTPEPSAPERTARSQARRSSPASPGPPALRRPVRRARQRRARRGAPGAAAAESPDPGRARAAGSSSEPPLRTWHDATRAIGRGVGLRLAYRTDEHATGRGGGGSGVEHWPEQACRCLGRATCAPTVGVSRKVNPGDKAKAPRSKCPRGLAMTVSSQSAGCPTSSKSAIDDAALPPKGQPYDPLSGSVDPCAVTHSSWPRPERLDRDVRRRCPDNP
jgi:hypothetical protein